MKKVVRMLGLCALVALAFTSCKKNETNGNVTFKATISQPKSDSRTHIEDIDFTGGKALYWDANNQINMFNRTSGENQTFKASVSADRQVATFEGSGNFLAALDTDSAYIAFYPNAQKDSESEVVNMTIPKNQSFVWDTFDNDLYPMFGFNDASGNIVFHSHAGVLYLRFKLDQNAYGLNGEVALSKIIVEGAEGEVLSGTMAYDLDGGYTMTGSTEPNVVELDCTGCSVVANRLTEFYIVLPEGALQNRFDVTIVSANNTQLTFTGEAGIPIAAETIKIMPQVVILGDF